MRSTQIAVATASLVTALGLAAALAGPRWFGARASGEPVLVILVRDRSGVALVRAAVDPGRIVAERPDALALAEGRVVAAGPEAVPALLGLAGWQDRELELFGLPARDAARRPGAKPLPDPEREARRARLYELMKKPMLSAGEGLFVLQAMNDGLL
ncbi:MAG: hypothetical protein JSU66_02690 [Deltaproteobacteria bacterium]|nr:MAG: hypothetical protein JSU66_02690 [Deltaproteobacteria bacterium]